MPEIASESVVEVPPPEEGGTPVELDLSAGPELVLTWPQAMRLNASSKPTTPRRRWQRMRKAEHPIALQSPPVGTQNARAMQRDRSEITTRSERLRCR